MITRAKSFKIAGTVMAGAGSIIALTLGFSWFTRYMYMEDLQLDVEKEVFRQLVELAPAEKGLLFMGLAFVIFGIVLIVLGRERS